MPPPVDAPTRQIAIAGAGPVALALGRALQNRGIAIACIASRDPAHAREAAAFLGSGTRPVAYGAVASHAHQVLIAVSDRAITPVAEELARGEGGLRVALHTCGSHGAEVLAPLAALGVACGSLHPLQTIRDPGQGAAALHGAAFAICGEPAALAWAAEIAGLFGGPILRIPPGARPLYHAAAVMASNCVSALLDSAEQLLLLAGVPPEDARRALAPLALANVENAAAHGARAALTGPVVRGDAATVSSHTLALRAAAPTIGELYRAAGLHALTMARARGLDEEQAERVREALLERR